MIKKQIAFMEYCIKVILKGNIHNEDANSLRPELINLIDTGHKDFLIDMENVSYIDSSGIALFLAIHKKVAPLGGTVTFIHLHGVVKELFAITQMETVFTIRN